MHLTGNVPICRTSLVSSAACQRRKESPQGTTYHQLLHLHELQPWTGRRTSPRLRFLAQVRAKTCASPGMETARARAVSAPRGGCLVFRGTRGQVGPYTCPSAAGGGAGALSGTPEAVLYRSAGPHGTPVPGARASQLCAQGGLLSSRVTSASERSANSVKSWKVSILDFAGHIWFLLHIMCSCFCFLPGLKNVKPACVW